MRRLLAVLIAGLSYLVHPDGQAQGQAPEGVSQAEVAYAAGVAAFQRGDYAAARTDFLDARAEGYAGVQLDYSLGATCYELGLYEDAKQEFTRLLGDTQIAPLAHYNLGRIAVRQGDVDTARDEFLAAYSQAATPEIRQLAAAELARLPPPAAERWYGYADLSTGYDDDVAPLPLASLEPPERQGSPLVSLLAGGGGRLTGSHDDGWQLQGSVYRADYSRLSSHDETLLLAGPGYRLATDGWRSTFDLLASHVILGRATLEDSLLGRVEELRDLSPANSLGVGYEYERVVGGSGFDYLTGGRQALFLEDRFNGDAYQALLSYQHESNRRNDLSTGGEFFSASPLRNRFHGELTLKYTDAVNLRTAASYEKSLYGKSDVVFNGAGFFVATRDDDLYTGSIGGSYEFTKQWSLLLEFRYLKNASNDPVYSYQSHRLTLTLQHLFL
ncbi:MAG: tetratricopeptide repeat protein [Bacillota bacterium]